MVQEKKMDEELFARLHKELTTAGELIRARQEEKQGVYDDFDSEAKRFFFGKISERALAASVKKTNNEISRLNGDIRRNIALVRNLSNRISVLAAAQAPTPYRATLSGMSGGKEKKVSRVKTKKVRRKSRKKAKEEKKAKKRVSRRKVSRRKKKR